MGALLAGLTLAAGCTVHPAGEREERRAALSAGRPYEPPVDRRPVPPLPDRPTPDDLVRYALLTNADVERAYWEWRAAVEQVPIDGTQATNLAFTGSVGISHGRTSLSQTTITAGNDPMADIVLPNKLDAAARRALELARAAGKRFRQAQFDLRAKVISAYDDYALTAELSRLGRQNVGLLATVVAVTQARSRAGAAGQQDVLRAQNELDLARNDVAANDAQLPAERATLNALLNRPPDAALPEPPALPPSRPVPASDREVLILIARQNPQLLALADEAGSRRVGIEVARLLYEPDVSILASTDLKGIAQTVSPFITVPILKYEAIRASVAQAEADLRATEAARRQAIHDLSAQAVADLATLRDADRQLDLYERSVLPRARQIVTLGRSAYESGAASLLDVLDGQRSLVEIERLVAQLRAVRDRRLADVESLAATHLMAPLPAGR